MLHASKAALAASFIGLALSQSDASAQVPQEPPNYAAACTERICIDRVDECGQWYGGCFSNCGGSTTWPSYTPPPCTKTKGADSAALTAVPENSRTVPSVSANPTPLFLTASRVSAAPSSTCSGTICIDATNACGKWYGGCYPYCHGGQRPTPTPPPCPSTPSGTSSIDTASYPSASLVSQQTLSIADLFPHDPDDPYNCNSVVCDDYMNSCGLRYGGCYRRCSGYTRPSFSAPVCPVPTAAPGSGFARSTITLAPGGLASCTSTCDVRTDACGYLYGPGCYTSCPGDAVPAFSTPVCVRDGLVETGVVPLAEAQVTA